MTWRTVGMVMACVLAVGCGPDPSPSPMEDGGAVARDAPVCSPNTTLPCACLGGRIGMQYCTVYGQLDVCACPTARDCVSRHCGPDGVGGLCGDCPTGQACNNAGQCICTPNCNGRSCGADGCGGVCGLCERGFRCGDSGSCEVDPASRWVITATSGTVATAGAAGAWDSFGGAPDPQVCITLSGQRTCTPYVNDTFSPTWNFAFPATTAEALQAGILTSYIDYDSGSADDTICDLRIRLGRMAFESGGSTAPCPYGSWSFTLRAQ